MKVIRRPWLLIVTLLLFANLYAAPPTKRVRIKPRKIEVKDRQFGSIQVDDRRSNKENIGYIMGIGKFKTYLELDANLEEVFLKFLQNSLSPMEEGQVLIIRIHNLDCHNKQKFNSVTATADMDVEVLKATTTGEEQLFRNGISKEYKGAVISGRTFGVLIEDILEECLEKGNQALNNR